MKGKLGQLSYRRGVRVEWLVDWTNKHKFWDRTSESVLEFVKKQTAKHKKCCYVDMPIFRSARDAGQVM